MTDNEEEYIDIKQQKSWVVYKNTIYIPYYINKIIKNIPEIIEIIIFENENKFVDSVSFFNKQIKYGTLTNNIKEILFGYSFNQEIIKNTLSKNLERIEFGYSFNKIIKEKTLPKNLKILKFGNLFNKELKEKTLPRSLQILSLGENFNIEIKENVLSKYLNKLIFCSNNRYDYEIKKNILPKNLSTLILGYNYKKVIFTENIKEIKIIYDNESINYLPTSLKTLHLCVNFLIFNKKDINLPPLLEEIIIKYDEYKKFITKIPFGCKITVNPYL
jgi:hypothetical protein